MDSKVKKTIKEIDLESRESKEYCGDSEYNTSGDIFKCIMCGDCCTGFGGTYITDEDVKKIANFIQCDKLKFISQFCTKSGSKYVLNQNSKSGKCVFFDSKNQCTIHPVKPRLCRNWPFISTVVKYPENWNMMANSCPGMIKNVPHDILVKIISSEIKNQRNI